MKKTIIPLLLLTFSSIFAFGHALMESQTSSANIEQTSSQPILTAYQMLNKGKDACNSKNYIEGVKWFRQAAEQGDAEGQNYLGFMYEYGYGVAKDYSEAVKWYRKAAEQGNADGQNHLGHMYGRGYGVTQDYSEAVKWYRQAAEQGNTAGQCNLGYMYDKGLGVAKDYSEAVKWYRKAAEQGEAKAQQNLGYMYDKGFGVPKDYSEAVKWYRKAAEQGYPIPQCSLGDMYYYGHGVEKDLSEAKKWWEKAAAQGFGPAKDNLKKLQATEPTDGIPTLFWIECPAKTGNSQFALKVGVNSSSAIRGYDVMLNGSATRGIKTVTNDGYDLMIDQPLTLAEGNNEIRVEATNASGRTVETRSVVYEKAVKPSPAPEQVQKRIALVVGNGAYSGAPLRNTLNDATAIASELRGLGFEVIFISDANKKKFDSAVNDFGLKARDYDVAMFYYAGHGIQYKGENFLVPVDATLSTQSDVEYECVNVNRILSKLEDSDVKMKIIALDACRNNPFERSWHRGAGSSRGLSAINVPIGTFISYATSPGTVAADGEGDHSPYTSALLQTLKERNLPIESVFKKVASIVVSTTGRSQLPWYTSSLFEGEFVFNPTQK